MVSCTKCERFSERFNIATPGEYRSIVRQLIEMVQQGTFELAQSSCALEEILEPTFPSDTIFHRFKCTLCERQFELPADTYHGHVSWRPID